MSQPHQHPTIDIPIWDPPNEDTTTFNYSPQTTNDYVTIFDSFTSDEFRMYEFKVRACVRSRSHDWTECPFSHPGEKARRRDPRRYHYSGVSCPEFRRGSCRKGDACELSHGVFECWLHPSRYRTQPCKDGYFCQRRVCFFAHDPGQIRVIGSDPDHVSELMQGLSLGKVSPRSPWGFHMGGSGSGYGSPRSPTQMCVGVELFEEPGLERVESGRELRKKIYGKVSMENSLGCDRVESVSSGPDFEWVSELVK